MIINNKIIVIAVILLVISGLFFSGCASEQQTVPPATEPAEEPAAEDEPVIEEEEEEQLFTMEEIATFDGQDGRPAYIVVNGVVYDVTGVSQWRSGTHFGFSAGTDVTEALAGAAPHGSGMLNQAEIVGRITE